MKLWRYGQSVEMLGRRYRLEGMLGSGGMADVCLAWDEREQREVALKILKSDDLDQETLNRFMKEAAQIAHWRHPHILRVYESLQIELIDKALGSALYYMVSEYARGGDLQKRLTPGKPFPLSASFALFRQLCDAVQYAHEGGVIHRDLKPLNVLFRRPESGPEEVVLSDFGLAVQVDASHHTFARGGTLAYMAPEQFQGHAQPASDIFALGVILYVLCTGNLPFRRSLQDIPRVIRGQTPAPARPSLLNPELPPALDPVILRALRDQPAERYRQPRDLWSALELSLTSGAITYPFSATGWQKNAGQTWPYDGSEQPQRSRQAGLQGQAPTGSAPHPDEDEPEVEEGPVSALWIAREKQKASPVRLPLPTDSILRPTNPTDYDELEPLAADHEAALPPASWQPSVAPVPVQELWDAASSGSPLLPDSRSGAHPTRQTSRRQPYPAGEEVLFPQTSRRASRSLPGSPPARAPRATLSDSSQAAVRSRLAHTPPPPATQKRRSPGPALSPRTSSRGRGTSRRQLLPTFLGALVLLLLVLAILFASHLQGMLLLLSGAPVTRITLTPRSTLVQQSFPLAVRADGNPPGSNEIPGRQLTTTSTQTATAHATGTVPGIQATGQLTFLNNTNVDVTIQTTVLVDKNGVKISFTGPLVIPANPPSTIVQGFAVEAGTAGNVPTLDLDQACCAPDNEIFVKNTAFTGGQDPQPNGLLQQKDISGAAKLLITKGQEAARQDAQKQMQVREQEGGQPVCQAETTSSQKAGARAKQATVQVVVTCSSIVYDAEAARQQLAGLLQTREMADPQLGAHYALDGPVAFSLTSASPGSARGGSATTLVFHALGRWVYRLSASSLSTFAEQITGKSQAKARAFLLAQPGILDAHFSLSGNLPLSASQIQFSIQQISPAPTP